MKETVTRYNDWVTEYTSSTDYETTEATNRADNAAEVDAALAEFETEWASGNFDFAGDAYGKYWEKVRGKASDFEDVIIEIDPTDGSETKTKIDRDGAETFEKIDADGTVTEQGTIEITTDTATGQTKRKKTVNDAAGNYVETREQKTTTDGLDIETVTDETTGETKRRKIEQTDSARRKTKQIEDLEAGTVTITKEAPNGRVLEETTTDLDGTVIDSTDARKKPGDVIELLKDPDVVTEDTTTDGTTTDSTTTDSTTTDSTTTDSTTTDSTTTDSTTTDSTTSDGTTTADSTATDLLADVFLQ